MSIKELVLVPKQKYKLLTEKQSPETVSVETQTCIENQLEMKLEDDTSSSLPNNILDNKVNDGGKPTQAVLSPSWSVPGERKKRVKYRAKKSVKWIPY